MPKSFVVSDVASTCELDSIPAPSRASTVIAPSTTTEPFVWAGLCAPSHVLVNSISAVASVFTMLLDNTTPTAAPDALARAAAADDVSLDNSEVMRASEYALTETSPVTSSGVFRICAVVLNGFSVPIFVPINASIVL